MLRDFLVKIGPDLHGMVQLSSVVQLYHINISARGHW
jgi:hypothetical protein